MFSFLPIVLNSKCIPFSCHFCMKSLKIPKGVIRIRKWNKNIFVKFVFIWRGNSEFVCFVVVICCFVNIYFAYLLNYIITFYYTEKNNSSTMCIFMNFWIVCLVFVFPIALAMSCWPLLFKHCMVSIWIRHTQ